MESEEEYSRTVKPADYESIRVSHTEPYNTEETTSDEAFEKARRLVHKRINEELFHLDVGQLDFYPDLVIRKKVK